MEDAVPVNTGGEGLVGGLKKNCKSKPYVTKAYFNFMYNKILDNSFGQGLINKVRKNKSVGGHLRNKLKHMVYDNKLRDKYNDTRRKKFGVNNMRRLSQLKHDQDIRRQISRNSNIMTRYYAKTMPKSGVPMILKNENVVYKPDKQTAYKVTDLVNAHNKLMHYFTNHLQPQFRGRYRQNRPNLNAPHRQRHRRIRDVLRRQRNAVVAGAQPVLRAAGRNRNNVLPGQARRAGRGGAAVGPPTGGPGPGIPQFPNTPAQPLNPSAQPYIANTRGQGLIEKNLLRSGRYFNDEVNLQKINRHVSSFDNHEKLLLVKLKELEDEKTKLLRELHFVTNRISKFQNYIQQIAQVEEGESEEEEDEDNFEVNHKEHLISELSEQLYAAQAEREQLTETVESVQREINNLYTEVESLREKKTSVLSRKQEIMLKSFPESDLLSNVEKEDNPDLFLKQISPELLEQMLGGFENHEDPYNFADVSISDGYKNADNHNLFAQINSPYVYVPSERDGSVFEAVAKTDSLHSGLLSRFTPLAEFVNKYVKPISLHDKLKAEEVPLSSDRDYLNVLKRIFSTGSSGKNLEINSSQIFEANPFRKLLDTVYNQGWI